MPAGPDLLLEASGAGFLHGHSGFARQVAPDVNDVEIALGPGADHVGDIGGIAAPAQEVIGPGKRDEAFRMLRRSEDVGCIFDAHDVVGRRMEHQQGLVQGADPVAQSLLIDVIQEGAADPERAAGEVHVDAAGCVDLANAVLEQPDDVSWIAGSSDGHDRARFGNIRGGREHRRAAEAVPDKDCGRAPRTAKGIGGGDEIGDVR